MVVITGVKKGSPADKAGLFPRLNLLSVNAKPVRDLLDYKFLTYDRDLLISTDGGDFNVRHAAGGDIGLSFETELMDSVRRCANNCVFCFVDQQPRGLREQLYFKDDDTRLSFLTGNYITLTNLSEADIARIIEQRISPLRVSVHCADDGIRRAMLGNPCAPAVMPILRRLRGGKIAVHAQIVLCPGYNDGEALKNTLGNLTFCESVAIVPVGITRYRKNLPPLPPVDRAIARETINIAADYKNAYCADEIFLIAGEQIPNAEYYGEYPQLENGVGMLRSFLDEFAIFKGEKITFDGVLATGNAFFPFLRDLVPEVPVFEIQNKFWGETITVAGLVTGGDLISQLSGKNLKPGLWIPRNMLRDRGDLFLDGLSLADVSNALGVPVNTVGTDAGDLCDLLYGSMEVGKT